MSKVFLFFFLFLSIHSYGLDSDVFKIESLMRDGDLELAEKTIEATDLEKVTLNKLLGRLHILKGDDVAAIEFLTKALKLGSDSDSLKLMLSQSLLKQEKIEETIKAVKVLESIKTNSIQKDLLYAQGLWQEGDKEKAVGYLSNLSSRKYMSYDLIERQKSYYLFKMSKIAQIFKNTKKFYNNGDEGVEVGLYVVSLLKEKDLYLAESYFDLLLGLIPKNALLLKERGVFELEKGRSFIASMFFDKAAHLNGDFSYEASAGHLSLGNHSQAQFFNSKVKDKKKKVMQLFSIYLDSEDYEKALSLHHDLQKTGVLEEDKFVYALMYTAFKVRDYKTFNGLFYKITSKAYVAKVLKLKTFVDSCKKSMGPSCVFS